MITVVFVKNPFEPTKDREIHTFLFQEGYTVADYVRQCGSELEMKDVVISKNAHTFNGDKEVQDGDFIVFSPVVAKSGGKNPLLIIATVALAVVSGGVGGLVATGHWGMAALTSATGWAAIGGYLASAAVMFIGGQLIQHAFGTATPKLGTNKENPTYSWGDIQTTQGQNNPIPITYGLVRSGGQTIGKYLYSKDDKQYLNWLVSAGRGELEITDVRLNDNPVANYKDVEVTIRNGTNDQEIIPNFNDTISSKVLNYEILKDEWRTDIVTGNATEGIIFYVECSNGLYYAKDDGKLGDAWVEIAAEYAKVGTQDWKQVPTSRITGHQSGALRKEYRVDNIPEGEYQVRVKVTDRSHDRDNSRASTRIYWTAVASIVYDDFAYPCIALIGIKAMATDQLSGSPTLKFMKERKYVYVYNPNTKQYETRPANNPAWAAYDMIHQADKVKDARNGEEVYIVRGAKAELMMYDRFAEWAEYCDRFKLYCNIEINQVGELLELTNKYISAVGRGMVIPFGTRFAPVWDGLKDAVQMFGMGNIKEGTFQEDFLKTSDRANAVEVTFTNKQKGYQQDTIKVYSDTFDTDEYDNTTQIAYPAIDNMEQAYREGKFQLFCNQKMVRTVSFEADIDAIACTVGDVIIVAHDVPEWATSGSIVSVSGNTVVLDAPINNYDAQKRYIFAYRACNNDVRYEVACTVKNVTETTTEVLLSSIPDEAPQAGDVYDIAKSQTKSKKFVVRSISRAQDFTRKIEGLEYNEDVFNENYDIPTINYSDADNRTAQNVSRVIANHYYWTNSDGTKEGKVSVTWDIDSPYSKFSVSLSSDGGQTWDTVQDTTAMTLDLPAKYDGTYTVKIVTIYGLTASNGVQTAVTQSINISAPVTPTVSSVAFVTPPSDVTTTGMELWLGITSDSPSTYKQDIYISEDNQTFLPIGSAIGKAHVGTLSSAISATDTTVAVQSEDFTNGGSRLMANVVCIGDEFITYQTATRTDNIYTLKGCVRGAYGTVAANHGSGVQAVVIDNRLFEAPIKKEYAGKKLYFRVVPTPLIGVGTVTVNDVPSLPYTISRYYIPPVTNVVASIKYAQGQDRNAKYDIKVEWQKPNISSYLAGDVWYKRTGDTEWLFGGSGTEQVIIPQAVVGATYHVAVVTRDKWNNTNNRDTAPSRDVLVSMKSDVPNAPTNFKLTFGDTAKVSWDEVTNTDVAFYEIRTDDVVGTSAGLLLRTTDIQASLSLVDRSSNLYVFARNVIGQYSPGATLSYNKPKPKAPTNIEVMALQGGIAVRFAAIPSGCKGASVYIDNDVFFTATNVFQTILQPNVYNVKVSYVDLFGEGEISGQQAVTVKFEVTKDMLDRETLGLTEIDKAIAKIEGDVGVVKSDITSTQSRITQLSNSVDLRINSLDGKELISRINLSPTGTRIDGRLLHVTSDAVFDQNVITKGMIQAGAVTADKMQVDSLSAITQNVGELHGGTIIGGTFRNNDSSFQVLPNGDIIGANIIGSRIDAKSVYAEGEQLKPVHVSIQVVDSGDKIVLPEGYAIEKSIIYVLEYDLINSDYFASGIVAGYDYNGSAQKYYWINTTDYLPNKTDFGRTDWINGDLPHRVNEELKRRFPVHVEKEETKRVVDWFNNRSNFSYSYSTLMNQRVVWGIPYVNQGYYNENMFVFFGYQADAIFPQVRTSRMGRGVDKDDPQFGKHIVGVADDGTCYNCKVVYGLKGDPRRLYTTWGTIKVCVVSFW